MPPVAVQGTVLNGLRDMFGLDVGGIGQIGDGTGYLQDAVMGTGTEAEAGHCKFHEVLTGSIQCRMFSYLPGGHACIAMDMGVCLKPFRLALTGQNHLLS